MGPDATAEALIKGVYDTVVDRSAWQSYGATLCQAFSASSALVFVRHGDRGPVSPLVAPSWDESAITRYHTHFQAHDPFLQATRGLRELPASHGEMLVPEGAYARSAFWNDFAARTTREYRFLLSLQSLSGDDALGIAIHRPPEGKEFVDGDVMLLRRLCPHIVKAVTLAGTVAHTELLSSAHETALDDMGAAVLVCDGTCRLLAAGHSATRQFADLGCHVPPLMTEFALPSLDLTAKMRRLIANVAHGGHGGIISLPAPLAGQDGCASKPTLQLGIARLPCAFQFTLPHSCVAPYLALLTLRAATSVTLGHISKAFGLTEAEAAVAIALAAGSTVPVVARNRNVRESTVRTQVRSILTKTDTRNLRSLTKLIHGRGL